jgi:signal peptide peptidase SppA
MTIPFHNVTKLTFNTPLLVTPEVGETIGAYVLSRVDRKAERETGDQVEFEPVERADGSKELIAPRASQFVGRYAIDAEGRPLPYRVSDDGSVAIIHVVGELVNRGSWIGASSGLVSYEGIKHQVMTAGKDPNIRAVVFDLSSPGGEASGAFALAAAIRKVSAQKMTIAVVNAMACSGGYVIASACKRIVIAEDGYAGSIGVLWMHIDLSEYLAKSGIKPTYIFAGAHKVDGNPYEELRPEVKARIQRRIDRLYGMFVDCVAAGRANLTPEAIRATEAQVYIGADAVAAGLADEVGTFEGVIEQLAAATASASTNQGGINMAAKKNVASASLVETPKAGPGACSECDCPSFMGEGDNCERETCGHPNGSHADEAQGAYYAIGDRIIVKEGADHGDIKAGDAGEVVEIGSPALGVKFDGMDMVHRWYTAEEVEPESAADGEKKKKKAPMDMESMSAAAASFAAAGAMPLAVQAILEENKKLKAEAAKNEIAARAAQITALAEVEGRAIGGDYLAAAQSFGATLSADQFDGFLSVLKNTPKMDTSRIAGGLQKLSKEKAGAPEMPTAEDFANITKSKHSKRIAAMVAFRQQENPKFTAQDLYREVVGVVAP